MPTSRPRYQVTETPDIEQALELAEQKWPGEPRSKLLLRLVRVGATALQGEHTKTNQRRLEAIDATSGKYAGIFPPDYLTTLRQDWPE